MNGVAKMKIFGILGRRLVETEARLFTVGNNWNILSEELGKNGLEMGDSGNEIFICIHKVKGKGTIPTEFHSDRCWDHLITIREGRSSISNSGKQEFGGRGGYGAGDGMGNHN